MSLLWRSSVRYQRRHPWLLGLSIVGVALGVAVVVSIDLANGSARQAFDLSAATVTGKATHQIEGAAEGLDESVYRDLRVRQGIREAAPVVEGYVSARGRTFQVLGVDPFAEGPFRPYLSNPVGLDLAPLLVTPGAMLMAGATAQALGLVPGDTLVARVDGRPQRLRLVGVLAPGDPRSEQAMESLLVMDISHAQHLLDRTGRLDRIDLVLTDDGAGARLRSQIEASLPEGVQIVRSSARTQAVEQMTRAFTLNLTALSLLALVVGMFLIYNTMTFSVVQRRAMVGRLRALGVTRREVFALLLGEAVLIGLTGTVLGLLLGIVLGRGLVQLVTQTINDLYFVVTVRDLRLNPLTLLKGLLLGLGATVVAALAPAREATAAPATTVLQRSQEESTLRRRVPALLGGGLGLALTGGVLLWVPSQSITLSYAALFCVLMAFALSTPGVVLVASAGLRPLMGYFFGLLGRMAATGLRNTLSRTAVAIAALMIALAATIGVGVMVDSFRQTVAVWLGYSLQADVYIQPPSQVLRRTDATLQPSVAAQLMATPGVAGAYSVRRVEVASRVGPTELVAIAYGPLTRRAFRFKEGDPEAVWPAFMQPGNVIISEPYGYRHDLGMGDTLTLQTDRGPSTFTVRGVFYDYASDLGVVMMHRSVYEQFYDDRGFSGLALFADPSLPVDSLIAHLRRSTGDAQALFIRSNRALRDYSLAIFDRTFTITTVLRLLAVLVAFVGVLSALMALALERAREFAVLRATGLTPGQLRRYVVLQTALGGLVAGLLALPLGLVLAWVLIFVINKRSFGWTLQFTVSPEVLLQALALALVAAVLAGLYPAWKMARANPSLALRDE
jgi:putative ABC transport system permease protein